MEAILLYLSTLYDLPPKIQKAEKALQSWAPFFSQ